MAKRARDDEAIDGGHAEAAKAQQQQQEQAQQIEADADGSVRSPSVRKSSPLPAPLPSSPSTTTFVPAQVPQQQPKPVWAATLADSYASWEEFFQAIDRLGKETFQLFRNRTSNTAEWRNRHIDLRGSKRTRRKHSTTTTPTGHGDPDHSPPMYIPPQLFSHYSRTLVCTHGMQHQKKRPQDKRLRHHKYRRFVGCQCKIHATVRRKMDGSFFIGVRIEGDAHNHQLTKELYDMMSTRQSPKLSEFAQAKLHTSGVDQDLEQQQQQQQQQLEEEEDRKDVTHQERRPLVQVQESGGGQVNLPLTMPNGPQEDTIGLAQTAGISRVDQRAKGVEVENAAGVGNTTGSSKRHRKSQYKRLMQQLHLQQQERLAQQEQSQKHQQLPSACSELQRSLGTSNSLPDDTAPMTRQLHVAIQEILRAAEGRNDWKFAKDAFVQFDASHHDAIAPDEWQVYERGLEILVHEHAGDELAKVMTNLTRLFNEQSTNHQVSNDEPNEFHRIVLRYKVHHYCLAKDPVKAMEFLAKLQPSGSELYYDCYVAVMNALTRQDRVANKDRVLQLFDQLDPTKGTWKSFVVARAIETLGIIGEPAKAFEFFESSKLVLTGDVLIALLRCCHQNNCHQEAMRFLANRESLARNRDPAPLYEQLLKTLEWLDLRNEMLAILLEMDAKHISFTSKIISIVLRNQSLVQGTCFDIGPSMGRKASCLSRFQLDYCKHKLQTLHSMDRAVDAMEMALRVLRLVQFQQQSHPVCGATLTASPSSLSAPAARIPCELSEILVEIALKMQRYDVLHELVKSFMVHKADEHLRATRKLVTHFHCLAMQQPENTTFVEFAFAGFRVLEVHGDASMVHDLMYLDILALQSSANDERSWVQFALLLEPRLNALVRVGDKQTLLARYVRLLMQQKKLTISELVSRFAVIVGQQSTPQRGLSCADLFQLLLTYLCETSASNLQSRSSSQDTTRVVDDEEAEMLLEVVTNMQIHDVELTKPWFAMLIPKLCFAKARRHRLWVLQAYEKLDQQSRASPQQGTTERSGESPELFKYPRGRFSDLLECCARTDKVDLAEQIFARARREHATLVPVPVVWWSVLLRLLINAQRFDKAGVYLVEMMAQRDHQQQDPSLRHKNDEVSWQLTLQFTRQCLHHFAVMKQWLPFDSLLEAVHTHLPMPWPLEFFQPVVETLVAIQTKEANTRTVELLSLLQADKAMSIDDMKCIWQQEDRQNVIRKWFQTAMKSCVDSTLATRLQEQQTSFFAACERAATT